ncbi:MAG: hypothetical protein AAF456_08085, partial [Planctomycetota bacterium]
MKNILLTLFFSVGLSVTAAGWGVAQQTPMPRGEPATSTDGASFAPTPPLTDAVKDLFGKTVHIEPQVDGRPLPTNDWWTTLLSEAPFPGRLYAYPFTVSADGNGLQIWYPQGWNADGTQLEPGQPLVIEPIDRNPVADPTARLLYDFESDWETAGWTIRGDAFGEAPMTNEQHASRDFVGQQFAASFHKHDPGKGVSTSPEFTIDKPFLHFKVAGGDDRELLGVHLIIEGASVLQEVGARNNEFQWKTWNLAELQGKQAQIQLVDESQGGWGFISADHFVLSDYESLPIPDVISHASTLDWGDWHVAMRLHISETKKADVTFGRGLPYVWIEPDGIDLLIPGIVDENGVLEHDGRKFGVFA